MNRNTITNRIRDVSENISRLTQNLQTMNSLDIQHYPDHYEAVSTEAALQAEKIACQLRSLLYASTGISKAEYLTKASETHGIEIQNDNGILTITLPRLLHKKKSKQSNLFLLDPLGAALEKYTTEHTFQRFRECVVCISHVYEHELTDWRLPDYDNLQQKQLIDMIALYVMTDDSSQLCDTYNTTELGEKDCTKVYIMEKKQLSDWLIQRENARKTISDF